MTAATLPVYPRRQVIRGVLRGLIRMLLPRFADVRITGQENFPTEGPLLVVANHFSFLDPVAVIHATRYPLEFIGGFTMPNAPKVVTWIPRVWGILPVHRGTVSREALTAATTILNQNGVLGIFPEAGSWASVLRPARPGAALLASRTHARILPIGIDGAVDVFPRFRKGERAQLTLRIGKPFGPFFTSEHGAASRDHLTEIGHEMMRNIAELLPPERRGSYSSDPALREAAKAVEAYPWADLAEN